MKRFQKQLILILVIVTVATGYATLAKTQTEDKTAQLKKDNLTQKNITLINGLEFDALAKQPDTFVLDVHIPEQIHIPGTDSFIPFNEITKNADKLPQDKNTPILVYCRSGSMSAQAAQDLVKLGYTNIYDLDGGIRAYRESHTLVSLTPSTQDLGTVIYGDIPQKEFLLTNFTSTPMKITRISTSCSCTSAVADKKALAPYETAIITVSFNPAIHKDNTDLGDLTRTIYIDTDNPNFKQVSATITANVIKK